MKRIPTLLCASLCVIAAEAQNEGDGIRRTTKLPEVTVRLKPVEQVGDTIKYNVSAFQGKDDHYLEDVLKKMPGIQVSPNGTILYKGETINQFNIEGQNLLGNRYSQATRNLPVEAISQVQVMENDQGNAQHQTEERLQDAPLWRTGRWSGIWRGCHMEQPPVGDKHRCQEPAAPHGKDEQHRRRPQWQCRIKQYQCERPGRLRGIAAQQRERYGKHLLADTAAALSQKQSVFRRIQPHA